MKLPVEIFSVGKWNGMYFTEEDLHTIAQSFTDLFNVQKVPLKLGHNRDQKITDGQPALGWVDAVYVKGQKLFADFVDVPTKVLKAIQKKLYRRVSIELMKDVVHKGKHYRYVLDAVALLGADIPAVNNLADLDIYLASRDSLESNGAQFSHMEFTYEPNDKAGDIDMDELQKLQAQIQDMSAKFDRVATDNDALRKENETLKAEQAKFTREREERELSEKKAAVTKAREAADELFNRAISNKRITPAQRDNFKTMIGYSDDDRMVSFDADLFAKTLGIDAKQAKGTGMDEEEGYGGAGSETLGEFERAGDFLHNEALRIKDESLGKLDYSRSLEAAMRKHPKIAQQYRTETRPE